MEPTFLGSSNLRNYNLLLLVCNITWFQNLCALWYIQVSVLVISNKVFSQRLRNNQMHTHYITSRCNIWIKSITVITRNIKALQIGEMTTNGHMSTYKVIPCFSALITTCSFQDLLIQIRWLGSDPKIEYSPSTVS